MRIGRPREFDVDAALDRAMEVFWRRGYEGATLPALTEAMGINRPSLYAAFGNKEQLFRKALARYINGPAGYIQAAMSRTTGREAVEQLLLNSIELLTNPRNPGGCLVVQGALACGEAADSVRRDLAAVRAAGVDVIRVRLEKARLDGEISAEVDCTDLARYIATVMHGLGVQAASGATREQLLRVVETAMRAWPG